MFLSFIPISIKVILVSCLLARCKNLKILDHLWLLLKKQESLGEFGDIKIRPTSNFFN